MTKTKETHTKNISNKSMSINSMFLPSVIIIICTDQTKFGAWMAMTNLLDGYEKPFGFAIHGCIDAYANSIGYVHDALHEPCIQIFKVFVMAQS